MTTIAIASNATEGRLLFGPRVDIPPAVRDSASVDDICDLLEAAGPLTVRDIAGGLAVPVGFAVARVRCMVRERSLRRDEFGRYRLSRSYDMR